ncbi:MAG: FAD-binding oxidoreductase [Chloroflexi bacterium]|nr:FAD-binding oxidoreductase [Chloroflexota bacterium]
MPRRSFWAWGMETDEPTSAHLQETANQLSSRYGIDVAAPEPLKPAGLALRAPRISLSDDLADDLRDICSVDDWDRAYHTYGRSYPDRIRAFRGEFPSPPDVVARPRKEEDIERLLEWCTIRGYHAIPFGGGSSVVSGFEPEADAEGVVTIDMERLDQILEVDEVSRAARIQAGVYGPALDSQLRPYGLTMRHFPQSFEYSTLGGWLATRSGGHYATNHTRIDDFAESIRMISPSGVWESLRLPGSGAGPSPDRMVLGSEGTLGIITEAWMRVQARPEYRASAGVYFERYEDAWQAARNIAQAKLWPANLRLLDPVEGELAAGMDGRQSLLVIGFESSDLPQGANLRSAVAIARESGGRVSDDELMISDEGGRGANTGAGRQGPVGAWRESFIRAPYAMNATIPLGLVHDTFETAITWDRWPGLDESVRAAVQEALERVCGGGTVSCRFTHVYPDGPAPYYTFIGMGRRGAEIEAWSEIKRVASDAVAAAGGTITHHHAVGKLHRPWYDRQRPDLFAESLRAAKRVLDPAGILNPGVLIDPL